MRDAYLPKGKDPQETSLCFVIDLDGKTVWHPNAILGEVYASKGDNLIGEHVLCAWREIQCVNCRTEKVLIK